MKRQWYRVQGPLRNSPYQTFYRTLDRARALEVACEASRPKVDPNVWAPTRVMIGPTVVARFEKGRKVG